MSPNPGMFTLLAIRIAQTGYPLIPLNVPHPWPYQWVVLPTTLKAANDV